MIYDLALPLTKTSLYLRGSPNGLEYVHKLVPLQILGIVENRQAISFDGDFKDLLAAVDLATSEGYYVCVQRSEKSAATEREWNNRIVGFNIFDPFKYTQSHLPDRRLCVVASFGTEEKDPLNGEIYWKYIPPLPHARNIGGYPLDGVAYTSLPRIVPYTEDDYERLKQTFVRDLRFFGYPDAVHYVPDLVWDPITRRLTQIRKEQTHG